MLTWQYQHNEIQIWTDVRWTGWNKVSIKTKLPRILPRIMVKTNAYVESKHLRQLWRFINCACFHLIASAFCYCCCCLFICLFVCLKLHFHVIKNKLRTSFISTIISFLLFISITVVSKACRWKPLLGAGRGHPRKLCKILLEDRLSAVICCYWTPQQRLSFRL